MKEESETYSPELKALAQFAVKTDWNDLPISIVQEIKSLILDAIGCALAGLSVDPGKMIVALAKRMGGPPESSIIGTGYKVSIIAAVLANGQLINVLDYDGLLAGHGPPYIVPPPLNTAEIVQASGKDLILATAIACEVAARVKSALPRGDPAKMEREGYANMNFGVAAAVGKLLGLDEERMINAFGIAGHAVQVLTWRHQNYMRIGYYPKYGLPGWQNTGGVMAALLAEMGYLGDPYIFDPEHGFWKYCGYGGWNPEHITEGLGEKWIFPATITHKRFPCCGVFSGALEGFCKIIEENNLMPDDITCVRVYAPAANMHMFKNTKIRNIIDAQFSVPYNFAVAAFRVPIGTEWQDMSTMRNPKILDFMKKVIVIPELKGEKGFVGQNRVEVEAKGKIYALERPSMQKLSIHELAMKFRRNAERVLTEYQINKAIEVLRSLEEIENIDELIKYITLP